MADLIADASPKQQARDRALAIVDAVLELRRDDVALLTVPQRLRLEQMLARALVMVGDKEAAR